MKRKHRSVPAPHQAYYDAGEAADYLGVSLSFFEDHVRKLLAEHDFRAPGSEKPMPKFSRQDLDAWAATRRRVKVS